MNRATTYRARGVVALTLLLAVAGMANLSCDRGGGGSHNGGHGGHGDGHGTSHPPAARMPSGTLADGVRVVRVEASQFKFAPDAIVVVQGQKVRLEATSTDVAHGIRIDGMGIDRRLDPGRIEIIEFTPDRAGNYHFHCSVYCGEGHDRMHGEIIVLSADTQPAG